jgi:hypothetical protein
MQLYIPEIADHIRLTNDWSFKLYDEYRNDGLKTFVGFDSHPDVIQQKNNIKEYNKIMRSLQNKYNRTLHQANPVWSEEDTYEYNKYKELFFVPIFMTVILPESTILSIDRIYIRKGASDYSSISFYLKSHPTMITKKKPRFWAKLEDCNNIMFEKTTATAK